MVESHRGQTSHRGEISWALIWKGGCCRVPRKSSNDDLALVLLCSSVCQLIETLTRYMTGVLCIACDHWSFAEAEPVQTVAAHNFNTDACNGTRNLVCCAALALMYM
jgi:hypothetical protein